MTYLMNTGRQWDAHIEVRGLSAASQGDSLTPAAEGACGGGMSPSPFSVAGSARCLVLQCRSCAVSEEIMRVLRLVLKNTSCRTPTTETEEGDSAAGQRKMVTT